MKYKNIPLINNPISVDCWDWVILTIFNDKYIITLDQFGASGKKEDVYKKFGFDVDSLEEKIEDLLI